MPVVHFAGGHGRRRQRQAIARGLPLARPPVPVARRGRIQHIQEAILPPVITKGKPATAKLADRMAAGAREAF